MRDVHLLPSARCQSILPMTIILQVRFVHISEGYSTSRALYLINRSMDAVSLGSFPANINTCVHISTSQTHDVPAVQRKQIDIVSSQFGNCLTILMKKAVT